MSDETDPAVTSEGPDESGDASRAGADAPAPRPRSAASRARRIGGAAAAKPRADGDTGPAPSGAATSPKPTTRSKDGAAATPAVALGKSGDAGSQTNGDSDEAQTPRSRTLTLSLPRWAEWAPTVVFAAVAVVFLVLFAVARFGGGDAASSTSPQLREKVLASAKTCLATLNTYRYDKLDAAEAAGVKCTTGRLTTDYKNTVTNIIRKNAPSLQPVQQAKINTAGIESVTANGKQWSILAYGQISITTTQQKQGRVDPFAVLARMEQVNGSWVLSKIDTVSSFSS